MSLGLIPDLVGGLFDSSEKGGDVIDTTPKWLQELGKQLGATTLQGLKDYTPGAAYTGNLNVAGSPTSQEQTSLDQLTQLLGNPGTGSLFDQASGQISDTLNGKYADPKSSPYIQALTKLANNQLQDQITTERGQRGARGTYYTDAGVKAEDLLRGRTLDNLQGVIGSFIQNERQNQLGAANTAQGLDQYKNLTLPLAKIQAGQTYGSLSRTIQQANLESQYQDYLRQRTELTGNAQNATTLAINQPNITPGQVTTPKYQANNDLGNILGIADQSIGSNSPTVQALLKVLGVASGAGAGSGVDPNALASFNAYGSNGAAGGYQAPNNFTGFNFS